MAKRLDLLQDIKRQQGLYEQEISHRFDMINSALYDHKDIAVDGAKYQVGGFYRGVIGYNVDVITQDILDTLHNQHAPMADIVFSYADNDIRPRSIMPAPGTTDALLPLERSWISVVAAGSFACKIAINWLHLLLDEHIIVVSLIGTTEIKSSSSIHRVFMEDRRVYDFPSRENLFGIKEGDSIIDVIKGKGNDTK